MRRRTLLLAGGVWFAAAPLHAFSQPRNAPRIAFVHPGAASGFQPQLQAFRAGLKELGYEEGRNIQLEVRSGENRSERLAKLVADVVAENPDVIVTATSAAIRAFKSATSSIPVIFAATFDPVGQGFVSSLQRPGGNITGVIVYVDLGGKLVELTRDAMPLARRLGTLIHEPDPSQKLFIDHFEPAARRFNFEPIVVRVTQVDELDRAFKELTERKAEVVIAESAAFLTTNRQQIIKRASAARLPLFSSTNLFAESGALLSYGTLTEENWRRAAALVDRILRGAKPADLAVEQPERFYLVVNRKAARAIGFSIPPVIMLRADRVID